MLDNTTIRDRIKLIIIKTSLNDNAFAKRIGVTQSVIASMFKRETEPSAKVIVNILHSFPEISAEWLLRGLGPMLLSDSREVRSENSNNKNTNINDSQTMSKLLSMLEEKDKQINKLLEIIKNK